jgi:hypothetical protein
MPLIHVPRPPKTAMDPNRAVSSLLRTQIEHLHQAEQKLPPRYRTNIYVNAIKTQGEAAQYSRQVTEAILSAHQQAAAARGRGIAIAAAAEETSGGGAAPAGGGKVKKGRTGKSGKNT